MSKKNQTFKELRDFWYKKLEKSGFKDIEDDKGRLKQTSFQVMTSEQRKYQHPVQTFAKQNYYLMASNFLNDNTFKNKKEQYIWTLHSEGLGARQIYKILEKTKFKYKSLKTINRIITALDGKMRRMYMIRDKKENEQ